jgi:chloride channel protein, CIC family
MNARPPRTPARPLPDEPPESLGDFTATARMLPVSLLAIAIGAGSAWVALALLRLIGLCTNLFFFHRWSFAFASPADAHLGAWGILVPIAGALIIGLMARFGSERIRGHGIPEALEAILVRGSRVEPRLAILKPISSAVSIGSGGPFGAEGPIIMSGGAFGSLIAQLFHLTSAERKTLLVAGAAAGMAATFDAPIASVLLAVELLLFEWKPRSVVPVALACATAAAVRHYLLGSGPLFPVAAHPAFVGPQGLAGCVIAGLLAGGLSALLTASVYASEDVFSRLRLHWMWWPAIGGLAIGIGGFFEPRALGVGYDVIGDLLAGKLPGGQIVALTVVKWLIWAIALGSGTSGGVLAPLLILGGALGGLEATFFPNEGLGFWPLVSMGAILGGTMRSPFTGVVFALELTHDLDMLLPLLVAVTVAHGLTVLVMRRSILTEKVIRRGFHVSREYAIDPLEVLFVREVMRTGVVALPAQSSVADLAAILDQKPRERAERLYPVVGDAGELVGVVTRVDLHAWRDDGRSRRLVDVARPNVVTAYPDEPLRVVVYRMAESGRTRLPVVSREDASRLVGLVTLSDLLKARVRHLEEETRRERVLPPTFVVPSGLRALWRRPARDSRVGTAG